MQFSPIGFFRGKAFRKYDAPRQAVYAHEVSGVVELLPGQNYEQALRDLDGFERIWIVFVFDRNGSHWRTTTRPPIEAPGHRRVGTFASRSPYRPNPIGLSCVRLVGIKGRRLFIEESDLLDGTPVLDIKPYLPAADSFPHARAGWVEEQQANQYAVECSPLFSKSAGQLLALGGPDLVGTVRTQLAYHPFDGSRKRVAPIPEEPGAGILSIRMFRIRFQVDETSHTVCVRSLASGYSAAELLEPDDPYNDKELHRRLQLPTRS